MDPVDARRWIAGFEAAAAADRAELQRRGPRPEEAIRLALSLIAAARTTHATNPLRDAEEAAVNATWVTLHRRLRR